MVTPLFSTQTIEENETYGKFVIEPLALSFGQTMGNALRRTLLSSLKGSAVVGIKIDGADHLFSPITGVKESALEIALNLKQVHFLLTEEKVVRATIDKKGAGKIFAKDIQCEIEIINKDLYIGEITNQKENLHVELLIGTGYGYIEAEEQENKETGFVSLDSSFSPVTKVNFSIEGARVGRKTNFERLIIEVWTNGTVKPSEAIKEASKILSMQFGHIFGQKKEEEVTSGETTSSVPQEKEIDKRFYDLIIDELNLPSRVVNALLRENIETVADLIKMGQAKLVGFKGLGKKSIDLVAEELKKLGVDWS